MGCGCDIHVTPVIRVVDVAKIGKEEQPSSSNHKKKDSSHVTCFGYHNKGNYANQCQEKKKGKGKQQREYFSRSVETIVGVDASKFEIPFSMVYCLLVNTIIGVGWYMNNGASRHATFDRKIFNKF
jgi:hypothetical protein